jgi:hypothetical protein
MDPSGALLSILRRALRLTHADTQKDAHLEVISYATIMTTAPAPEHLSPASAAGIIFQVHRVLTHLIRDQRAERVGFELFDDVAVEDLDGRRTVEQDKLEPLTDESEALWKTLRNWVRTYRTIDANERASTRFCVVTKASSPPRSPLVVKLANPGKTTSDVDECVALLSSTYRERVRRRATIAACKTPGKPPKDEDLDDYMRFVLDAKPEELRPIVECMSIVFGSDPVSDSHRDLLRRSLILMNDEHGERILNTALGWLTTCLLQFVGKKQDCWIKREHFARQLYEARFDNPHKPVRVRGHREITEAERLTAQLNAARLYEARLRDVSAGDGTIRMATERYLNHRAELLELTTCGAILTSHDGAFRSHQETFYDQLHEGWTSLYLRLEDDPPPDPVSAGRRLFHDVVDRAMAQRLTIGRVEVQHEYFVEGGYHALANQDHPDAEVWWLPALPLDSKPTHRSGRP